MRTVVGIFNTQTSVERAVNELDRLGIEEGDLRVVGAGSMDSNRSWLGSFASAFRGGSDQASGELRAMGLSAEEAAFYSQAMDADSILVAATVKDEDYDTALGIIRQAGGETRAVD